MDELQIAQDLNRRHFLAQSGLGLGAIALGSLLGLDARGAISPCGSRSGRGGGLPGLPHFAPRAKRVIYLFQSGAPSQIDLFDDKPAIRNRRGIELPDSVRMGQRITTMTSGQKSLPVAPSIFKFARHGQSGASLERAAAPHGEGRGRAVHHPVRANRGDQPRPGDHLRPDRLAACGAAEHGGLGGLRPGDV